MTRTLTLCSLAAALTLATGCIEPAACGDTGTHGDTGATTPPTPQACDGVVLEDPDYIEAPTTWSCTVRLGAGDYYVRDVLTIEPCTTIEVDARLFVADGGRIEAIGTPDCPITFTSNKGSPGAGDWTYISHEPSSDNGNVYEHVIFEYGGSGEGILTGHGEPELSLRDVTVRHTEAMGLNLYQLDLLEGTRLSFEAVPGYPLSVHGSDAGTLSEIGTTDVQEARIRVRQGGARGTLSTNDVWFPQTIPYELDPELRFEADYTMEAGVHLVAPPTARFWVGAGGTLTFAGTAESPVVFESADPTPAPGDWNRLGFESDSGGGSVFTHAVFRHAGSGGQGAIYLHPNASLALDSVLFEDNLGCDVEDSGTLSATNSPFQSCL